MATSEDKVPAKKAVAEKKVEQKKDFAQTIIQCQPEKEIKVVCDVCGYANPEYTAICKQCSNYLQ